MSQKSKGASQTTSDRQLGKTQWANQAAEPLPATPLARAWSLLRTTINEWQSDNASRLAAALAYYTVFSMAPLLIITIALVGLFVGPQAAQGQVVSQLQGLVGRSSAEFIQSVMASTNNGQTNVLLSVIGVITLLLGATGVFGELQSSLNQIWGYHPRH